MPLLLEKNKLFFDLSAFKALFKTFIHTHTDLFFLVYTLLLCKINKILLKRKETLNALQNERAALLTQQRNLAYRSIRELYYSVARFGRAVLVSCQNTTDSSV